MISEEQREKNRRKSQAWRAANPDKHKERCRDYYHANREARLAYAAQPEQRIKKAERMRAMRARDPELSRLKFRAWNYGLTLERTTELLAAGCAVCGSRDELHIDHDHRCCPGGSSPRSCGQCVRGVLCHGCNTALGLLGEDPARIEALLAHVRSRS